MLDTERREQCGRKGRAAAGVGFVQFDCVRNLSPVHVCLQLKLTTQALHASIYIII